MITRIRHALLAPAVAAAVAFVVSSIALMISGNNPLTAFAEMWKSIDSIDAVVAIINRATPYYVAGVAVAIGFKMNLFNIGANGQYILATLLAAAAGAAVSLPPVLHVTMILVIAVVVGAAWAAIAGVLKVTRGVNEVISTIMLNYIATGITAFLVAEYLRNKAVDLVAETKPLPKSAQLPPLNRLFELVGLDLPEGVVLQGFLPFAVALGIGYHLMLNRSRFGYHLRVSGTNPAAARTAGINPKVMVLATIVLSGAVAGLIGMSGLLADPQFHKYGDQFPKSLGFTGISLALLGRNHPGGIAAAALVWATIERATQRLSPFGIPQEIGVILQGSFLLAAVIAFEVVQRSNEEAATRAAARAAAARVPEPIATGPGSAGVTT
ncbi:MAG: ABC transporter permease [Ilumatobacteraceae bacterium]|nr:MAG: ABC transporter permease [Actinomycetota bacterium]